MNVKLATSGGVSTQTTILVQLPDLPGIVVQIWALFFSLASFSANAGVAHAMHHDVNRGVTLSVFDFGSQWAHANTPVDTDGPGTLFVPIYFQPEPYELIGTQRWDLLPSGGTVQCDLMIHYTTRIERNRTRWNLMRSKTSFESD